MNAFELMKQQQQDAITSFRGEFMVLSNFSRTPFVVNGTAWPTSEHFFQANKTLNLLHCKEIRDASTPGIAKKMGSPRGYKGFKITLRENWELIRIPVMEFVVKEKFVQNVKALEILMSTEGHLLIEGNTWHDNFWGACNCARCRGKLKENTLGKLLVEVRQELMDKELKGE